MRMIARAAHYSLFLTAVSSVGHDPNPPANFLAIAWMLAMLQLLVISVFIYFRRAFLLGLLTTVRCGWPVAGGLLA